jgi:hypothetical protein
MYEIFQNFGKEIGRLREGFRVVGKFTGNSGKVFSYPIMRNMESNILSMSSLRKVFFLGKKSSVRLAEENKTAKPGFPEGGTHLFK